MFCLFRKVTVSSFISELVPDAIKQLVPYQSARRIGGNGRIWLNANELETGIDYQGISEHYHRYPDFLPQDVAKAYQHYCRSDIPTVAVRGADEAIDLLLRTFCQPGADSIVVCPPTYGMYQFCAQAMTLTTLEVALTGNDFQLDVAGVIKAAQQAKMILLCSPNNPTGNHLNHADLRAILDATREQTLVVIDEAYIDFDLQQSIAHWISDYPHLIVIRTLSKAFGLAAVRCGFIIASDEVMHYVMRLIAPYPLPDCSADIVLTALSDTGIQQVTERTSNCLRCATGL